MKQELFLLRPKKLCGHVVTKGHLTLIGMSYESKENAHLSSHLGAFFIRLNKLGRVSNWCQFSPPNFFGIFWKKIRCQKSDPKRTRDWKCTASCQLRLRKKYSLPSGPKRTCDPTGNPISVGPVNSWRHCRTETIERLFVCSSKHYSPRTSDYVCSQTDESNKRGV